MIIKSLSLKDLSVSELAIIKELDQKYFPFPWSDDLWDKSMLNEDYFLFFDSVHSALAIFLLSPIEKLGHLLKIVVTPSSRDKGVGAAILNASHSHFRVLGFERVVLEVDTCNSSAIRLYEKHGYKKIHLKKNFYSNGADAHIMEKHL